MRRMRIFTGLILLLFLTGTAVAEQIGVLPASPFVPPAVVPAPAVPEAPSDSSPELGKQLHKYLDKENKDALIGDGNADNLITLNFKEVPIADAITVLSKQAGINITLDRDIQNTLTVTSVYTGTSTEDAIRSITTGMDLVYKKTQGGFLLLPYAESYIDVNKVFQYLSNATQGSNASANNQQQQSSSTGGAAGSQMATIVGTAPGQYGTSSVALSDFGGYMDQVIAMIKPMLSKQGMVTYMPTGFIYVRDYPSRVKSVEDLFVMDNDKREEVDIKITILRIDYKKEYETGISWSKVFEGFKTGSPVQAAISGNFLSDLAGQTSNIATVTYNNALKNISGVAKLLSNYGDVKIVHTWETRALTGSVIPFDLTQLVWYSAGSVIQVINNQTITTPQVANTPVGLSLILNPTKFDDTKYLVNTSIKMSSVVSQQTLGDFQYPNIENNAVSVPIKLLSGEQVAISGFKIRSSTKNSVGVPLLSQIPILDYLFGYKASQNETTEIAVVISLNKKKGEKAI